MTSHAEESVLERWMDLFAVKFGLNERIISIDQRELWTWVLLVLRMYSCILWPLHFGFLSKLPNFVVYINCATEGIFFIDILICLRVGWDSEPHEMTLLRYLQLPLDAISFLTSFLFYSVYWRREERRYLLLFSLSRVHHIVHILGRLERSMFFPYDAIRKARISALLIYYALTQICIWGFLRKTSFDSAFYFIWVTFSGLFKELYREWIAQLPLLSGCDPKFMDQIEGLHASDGVKEQIELKAHDLIGEAAVACEIPHVFAVSACRECRMFWIDIQCFKDIMDVYFKDKKIILEKLKEWAHQGKFYHWSKKVEANIESELHHMEILRNSHAQHAIICGVPDYFTALEKKGEDFKVKDPDGRSPLHIAISRGASVDVIASLSQSKDAVNWRDNFGVTPLMEAIKHGDGAIVDLLIKEGTRLHCDDVGSFLCKTTSDGDLNRLNMALACPDVDPNAKSYSGRTALHVAARKGETSLVRALLKGKRPADVHLKDRWGFTAVNEAQYYQHDDVVHLLETYCDV